MGSPRTPTVRPGTTPPRTRPPPVFGRLDAREEMEDALAFKAEFCLKTGIQPSEFDAMTDQEVDAFVEAFNRLAKERK